MANSLFEGFWERESWTNSGSPKTTMAILLLAGVLGGALAPAAATIAGIATEYDFSSLLQNMGLGFASAGIGALVVADTQRDDRLTLFFFALLCAIAFPTILEKAIGDLRDEKAEITSDEAASGNKERLAGAGTQLGDIDRKALSTDAAIDLEAGLLEGIHESIEPENVTDENTKKAIDQALATIESNAPGAGFENVSAAAKEARVTLQSLQPIGEVVAETDSTGATQ